MNSFYLREEKQVFKNQIFKDRKFSSEWQWNLHSNHPLDRDPFQWIENIEKYHVQHLCDVTHT